MIIPVEIASAAMKVICPRALRRPSLKVNVEPPVSLVRDTTPICRGKGSET
jgi:hypothetical protein